MTGKDWSLQRKSLDDWSVPVIERNLLTDRLLRRNSLDDQYKPVIEKVSLNDQSRQVIERIPLQ